MEAQSQLNPRININATASFMSTLLFLLQSTSIKNILRNQPDGQPIKEGKQHSDLNNQNAKSYFYKALQLYDKNFIIPNKYKDTIKKYPQALYQVVRLLDNLVGLNNTFQNQDIHEHVTTFLNYIHDSISYPINANISGRVHNDNEEQKKIDELHLCYCEYYSNFWRSEYSEIVKHIYHSTVSVHKCCDCGHDGHELYTFISDGMSVLPLIKENPTLEGSLAREFRPELMGTNNMIKCLKCKKIVPKYRQSILWQTNATLIFTINRYRNDSFGTPIIIPNKLDIVPYMHIYSKKQNTKYKLVSLGCAKEARGGYEAYTAYKNSDDQWVKYDVLEGILPITSDIYKEVMTVLYEQVTDEEFEQLPTDIQF